MENKNLNNEDQIRQDLHKEKLGFDVPEDYFKNSKISIIDQISTDVPKEKKVLGLRPQYFYPIAASIVLLLGITLWQLNVESGSKNELTEIEKFDYDNSSEDILITSLMIDEEQLDDFADAYLFNEVILGAEKSEQQMENIFINSLFVEDSLIDSYINEKLVEEIVL